MERGEYTRSLTHSSSKLVAEAESVFIDSWERKRLLLSNNSVLEEGGRTALKDLDWKLPLSLRTAVIRMVLT